MVGRAVAGGEICRGIEEAALEEEDEHVADTVKEQDIKVTAKNTSR